jgi:hypothetical protein
VKIGLKMAKLAQKRVKNGLKSAKSDQKNTFCMENLKKNA